MVEEELTPVIEKLSELEEDTTVPKNVRARISSIIAFLRENVDLSMKINKALHELDEIANDSNLQSYTRTQIWGIVSLLEKI